MYVTTKGLFIVMILATIIWILVGYFYYIDVLKAIIPSSTDIPYWFVYSLLIIGYLVSVGIGFSVFYEKKLWKLE